MFKIVKNNLLLINNKYFQENIMEFNNQVFRQLVNELKLSMKLTDEEVSKWEQSITAKIIAAIPYAAGCDNPERYALANLSTLIIAGKNRSIYDMKKGESIRDRLDPIMNFKGGDPKVIEKGMKLLELISLEDHEKDKDEDVSKYNPVKENDINYEIERKKLISEINSLPGKELDAIAKPDELRGAFWL